jgi:hypothetical protein
MNWLRIGSPATVYRALGFNMRDELKMSAQDASWAQDFQAKQQRKDEERGANQQAMATPPPGTQMMEAQQQAAGGAPGAPAPAGAPNPMTGPGAGTNGGDPADAMLMQSGFNPGEKNPEALDQQADMIAQQIVQMPDRGMAQRVYDRLRGSNKTLHALVKQKAEQMRSQAASQGKASLSQQPQQ